MTPLISALDGLLVGALLTTASLALFGRGLVRGVTLFVAFGLLLAIAWVRLDAPDLALAEAAVGAGITGALLLQGVRRLRVSEPGAVETGDRRRAALAAAGAVALGVTLGVALVGVLPTLPLEAGPAAAAALARLPESAVDNPVTAVLLVFRGYDTLLEVAVVVAVVLGLRALGLKPGSRPATDPMLDLMVRTLLPAALLVAGWLLWRGADAPGGAFQAAAVLTAGFVVARTGGRWPPPLRDSVLGAVFVAGLLLFALMGLWGLLAGDGAMAWPESGRKAWILVVESGLTVTLAALLAALVPGGVLRSEP